MAQHTVNVGGDLQAAFNVAQEGDEIVLDPRGSFIGNYHLPLKSGTAPIIIRSSVALPDRRLTPHDAALLPTLGSPNADPCLLIDHVGHWTLRGLNFVPNPAGLFQVVHCQDADDILFDRLLLIVPDGKTMKRGILGNGTNIRLTRSHLAGVNMPGQDSQAFCAWDGVPYTVTDNFLEAASENVMFGGAGALSAARIPADILVEGNHFSKPLSWQGQGKGVKNLFELKTAKRVIIRGNLFEHCWSDAQSGYAIVFTTRNDNADAPWSTIEDVLFEGNVVRDADRGFNILGYNDGSPSEQLTRLTIRNNDVQCRMQCTQMGGEAGIVTIENNRVQNGGYAMTLYSGEIWPNGESQRNARWACESLYHNGNSYSDPQIFGDGVGTGAVALTTFVEQYNQGTPPPVEPPIDPPDPPIDPPIDPPDPPIDPPVGDTEPPSVSITSVKQHGKSANYVVSAVVTDNMAIEKVEFLVGGRVVASLSSPPYTATVKLAKDGTVTVRATDLAGNQAEEAWSI